MMSVFSNNLKRLLRERGLSIKELSKRTAIPASSLTEWINQNRSPKLTPSLLSLCKCLGTSLEDLLSEPKIGIEPPADAPRSNEEEILRELIGNTNARFISIHKGVYRLNVEKLSTEKKGD